MLYAIPKYDSSSLEMVKLVLQMIEAQSQQVPDSLKSMVYDVIDEAKALSLDPQGAHANINYNESVLLALEMQETEALASCLETITSVDMLQPTVASNVLGYIV